MNDARPALLLSVRPRFAEAILSGQKTVEVRRRRIGTHEGASVVLYASSPVMAVVGTARIERVETIPLEEAWSRYGHSMGISRSEFDEYLDGSQIACLLVLSDPSALIEPVPLGELRRGQHFQPPQSYRFVAQSDPRTIRELAAG
jgi:predicted transcriptional regulator